MKYPDDCEKLPKMKRGGMTVGAEAKAMGMDIHEYDAANENRLHHI